MKPTKTNKQTYQYGIASESLAIKFLQNKDYEIIATRYKTKVGEVDIIAKTFVDTVMQKQQPTLVFIEVKARNHQELIEVILRKSQVNRIRNAAKYFLAKNLQYQNYDIRFDFILFENSLQPQHFEAFFE